ncbi:hypothetical protein ARSEF4850_001341 [Beauveria asiatica]
MPLKDTISSPLEAGPSLLDAHHIPPQLVPALEYTSARLARKSLHLTLVVARRDYQLPPSPVLCSPPPSPPSTLGSPASPSRSRSFTRHLHLPRWGRRHHHHHHQPFPSPSPSPSSSAASSMPTSPRSIFSSPAYTPISPQFPRAQQGSMSPRSPMWPLTPMTPLSPPLPTTPSTTKSSVPTESSSSYGFPMTPQHGVRLIHHGNLPAKAEKTLQSALAKAGRKSGGGGGGDRHTTTHIAPALGAPACGLSSALFNDSVAQNDVLFSSDGLSLVALDRLYSLKAALSSYSKTGSPLRLEDAVDELRRYVLASGDKVSKMHLLRSYDWLNVSREALADLDRMYRRAYGGVEMQGGIQGMYFAPPVPETSSVWSDDEDDDQDEDDDDEIDQEEAYNDQDSGVYVEGLPDSPTIDPATVGMSDSATPKPSQSKPIPSSSSSATSSSSPPSSSSPTSSSSATSSSSPPSSSLKTPPLRVQTSMVYTPAHQAVVKPHAVDETRNLAPTEPQEDPEAEAATARPDDEAGLAAAARNQLWCSTQSASIDEVLSPGADQDPPVARERDDDDGGGNDGPMTPNGYDDISPITRGEWGFLLVDRDFRNARTVAVTTC